MTTTIKHDNLFKNQLINDKKELAEHLMLLDLGRNDVGKVSKVNSVKVTEKFIIDKIKLSDKAIVAMQLQEVHALALADLYENTHGFEKFTIFLDVKFVKIIFHMIYC